MDSEKKWGCIGYALLALITWGLTQGFKVVCIIIGILIAILIAFIFISNLSTKRLIKKFKHQKDIYPNAYSFFRKELRIFQSENNLTKQDINKFLSFPKVEWEKREKLANVLQFFADLCLYLPAFHYLNILAFNGPYIPVFQNLKAFRHEALRIIIRPDRTLQEATGDQGTLGDIAVSDNHLPPHPQPLPRL